MSIDNIDSEDQLSHSKDLIKENIEQLKKLFPEIVTEGKIDFKILKQVLGEELEEKEEFYRFTWAGKSQARREAHKPSTGTLRPAKKESLDWDTTKNMYIEGDNLEVLKLLQKPYAGKIKMIYIDPPYNTGKDFIYKDNYKDNLKNYQELTGQIDSEGNKTSTNSDSDGRYHSNWLNMMYPRLRLARNLLREDGVIFISIDDNELENLKKISNEIFGEENSLDRGYLIWVNRGSTKGFNRIVKNNEYILAFSKNAEDVHSLFGKNNPDQLEDIQDRLNIKRSPKNPLSRVLFPKGLRIESDQEIEFKNCVAPGTNQLDIIQGRMKFQNGKLSEDVLLEGSFPYRNQMEDYFSKIGTQEITLDTKGQEWKEVFFKENGVPHYIKKRSTLIISSLIDDVGNSGSRDLELLGMKDLFDNPKPVKLIEKLLTYFTTKDDIILDFFSGSATTAEACLRLNESEPNNRSFIQIQLPEKTDVNSNQYQNGFDSISEIGKERIRRVIKSIGEKKPKNMVNRDLGFKVFQLDSSNIKSWDGNPDNLESSLFDSVSNIKSDRSEEDVLYEILLKYGLDLTLSIEERDIHGKKVFNVGTGSLFVCLANEITSKVAEGIGEWKEECDPKVCRVVFKDNGFTDVEKTNSIQILKRFGINEIRSI